MFDMRKIYIPTSGVSQIFSLGFSSSSESLALEGSVQAPERFHRLAWGPRLPDSPYSVGLPGNIYIEPPRFLTIRLLFCSSV